MRMHLLTQVTFGELAAAAEATRANVVIGDEHVRSTRLGAFGCLLIFCLLVIPFSRIHLIILIAEDHLAGGGSSRRTTC